MGATTKTTYPLDKSQPWHLHTTPCSTSRHNIRWHHHQEERRWSRGIKWRTPARLMMEIHSFYRPCTRIDTGEKRTSTLASWRSHHQQHLGGRKNQHRLQEGGVAFVGVTDVDKTSTMPAIGFPWLFPVSTVTIRPAGRGLLRQSLQRGTRHCKCHNCRPAQRQEGISLSASTTTGQSR